MLGLVACDELYMDDSGNNEKPEDKITVVRIVPKNYREQFGHLEDFSIGDLEVEATLSDGSRSILEDGSYEVDFSNYNNEASGEYEIIVSFTNEDHTTVSEKYLVSVLIKTTFKILSIGNSFSEDSHQFLFDIAQTLGHHTHVVTGNVTIGGSSLQMHYDNASNNRASYAFRKENVNGIQTFSGYTIKQALESEDWDFVTIQQVSQDSGRASTIPIAQLEFLTEYIKEHVNNEHVKIYWHSTWAYQQNSNHGGFANYNKDQITMYHAINEVAQNVIVPSGLFDGLIPNTTAIQNVRTSYIGDNLTRDGYHLSIPHGRFIASLMFYKAMTGKEIEGIIEADLASIILISPTVREVAVEAVNHAYINPYQISESSY